MMTDPLFASTHAALSFAFSHADRGGRANMLHTMSAKEMPPESRGLSGVDGAGNAGMILRHVWELPDLQRATVVCKFARPVQCPHCTALHDAQIKREAIEALVQHTLEEMAKDKPSLPLRRGLVRQRYGERIRMDDLARVCGVSQNTATAHKKKVGNLLAKLEREAMHTLDDALAGIVGETAHA